MVVSILEDTSYFDLLSWSKFLQKEIDNNSDRAISIVSSSILDVQLKHILKLFFVESNNIEKDLFSSQMPLSSFSAKINMSFYLGLISSHECKVINILRKVRNKFAHEINIDKFSDLQSIVDLCNNLSIPDKMYVPEALYTHSLVNIEFEKFNVDSFENESPRDKFIAVFRYISNYLGLRYIDVYLDKRNMYVASPIADILRQSISEYKKQVDEYSKQVDEYKSSLVKLMGALTESITQAKINKDESKINQLTLELQSANEKLIKYENEEEHTFLSRQLKIGVEEYFVLLEKLIDAIEKSYS